MTRASIDSAGPPGSAGKTGPVTQAADLTSAGTVTPAESVTSAGPVTPADSVTPAVAAGVVTPEPVKPTVRSRTRGPVEGHGPVERVMSTVIRKLAWSRLANPRVAITVAGLGLLLGRDRRRHRAEHRDAARSRLPLSHLLPSLAGHNILALALLYRGRHPRLPGAGRDAVGAQPGLAPEPAQAAAGQRGRRRGHGQPHAGRLIGYRELRGIRPDSGTGRESVHDQPGSWPSRTTRVSTRSSARCGRASLRSTVRSRPRSSDSPPRSAAPTSSPPSGS